MSKILLTGITGLVGSAFATELLRKDKMATIVAFARGNGNKSAETRVSEAITEQCKFDAIPGFAKEAISRIEVINHDIADKYVPIASDSNLSKIDIIFHCAADVNLGKDPFKKTYINNFQGTKNLLAIAKKLKVKSFHQVSTAYVAGKFEGKVLEDATLENIDFNNSYEKSKNHAESLVRASGIPYSIYRPSIVVGRCSDGNIRRPLAFYRLLEFLGNLKRHQCSKTGLKPSDPLHMPLRLNATPTDTVYFVPIDYVQKTITDIFLTQEIKNKTYHITGDSPVRSKDIEQVVCSVLKITGLTVEENVDKPTKSEKLIQKFVGDLLPYFSSKLNFDISNVKNTKKIDISSWEMGVDQLDTLISSYYQNRFPEIVN